MRGTESERRKERERMKGKEDEQERGREGEGKRTGGRNYEKVGGGEGWERERRRMKKRACQQHVS